MPRFLHTADWQIGRQFARFEADDGARLVAARLAAVQRIAALAVQLPVDAVLVAGDIFDMQNVSDKLLRRTFQAMNGFKGLWVLIPGNHDAALSNSVWTRAQEFGLLKDNIRLLDSPEPVEFRDVGFAVLPAPLTQRHTAEDLTEWFDTAQTADNLVRIGMAHGGVLGRLPDPAYTSNPIAAERAQTARLDYLALGDWHGALQVDPHTWYCGTPEADSFRTRRPGYALDITISRPGAPVQVTEQRIGQFDWHRRLIALNTADGIGLVSDFLEPLGANDVVRCKLSGQLDWSETQALNQLIAQAEARLGALSIDRTQLRLIPAESEISNLSVDGYLGDVFAELRAQVSDNTKIDDDPVLHEALALLSDILLSRHFEAGPR
ncbi:MAG: DNA repair exonuclease [Burkholderiaceae bacterium]